MTWLEWIAISVAVVLLAAANIQGWWIRWDMKLARMSFNGLVEAIEDGSKVQSMAVDEINALKIRVATLEKKERDRPGHSYPGSPLTN
jgi:hypothetical protein